MEGYIYLLLSNKDGKTYIGSTDNTDRRYLAHCSGKVRSTKHRRPLRLVYTEKHTTLQQARIRERYLKTRQGRKELKEIFKNLKM